jgi:hypothetical protein
MNNQDPLYFNGIDPRTGEYLFAPQSPQELARTVVPARGRASDDDDEGDDDDEKKSARDHAAELKSKALSATNKHLGSLAQDLTDLAQTGWGVVFPFVDEGTEEAARQQAIRDALKPLLDLRERQAGRYYKVFDGLKAFRGRDTKQKFLSRNLAGPGPSDPAKVPYYLLLVASPKEIPFSAQYQLDVQYAVGRLHFDSVDDYAAYANSVVAAETGGLQLARKIATFSVANADDPATQLSSAHLVTPLFDKLAPRVPSWDIRRYEPAQATKANLASLLGGGDDTPALLFTASHGAGFAKGDPLQRRHQGALICGDWPGPVQWARKPLPSDFYFSADDLATTANPHGTIVFNFACYGAGTPEFNDYGKRHDATAREAIADAAFQSALHQRLLSLPRGGALAAVGHVERAWGCSFLWPGSGGRGGSPAQLAVFESAMFQLMQGWPVGAALETFNQRYAELSSDLSAELEEISFGKKYDSLAIADMWTANNDARGYAITGDPAVRIPMAPQNAPTRRVEVQRIEIRTADITPAPQQPAPQPTGLTAAELARVFGGDGSLTVRTSITADPTQDGQPIAVSRIALDGSIVNNFADAASTDLRKLHDDLLQRAQAHRTALLQALAAAAARQKR